MTYEEFLGEIAPYVVVVGSFGRGDEKTHSDIDCFLRSRPVDEVDPEVGNDTYMSEILDIIARYGLDCSSVLVGHIAVEKQEGFPRMIEISSHYRIPHTEVPFYRDVDGVSMLCAKDDKTCDFTSAYDCADWDDSISDMAIRFPLPAFVPPAQSLDTLIQSAAARAAEKKSMPEHNSFDLSNDR